MNRDPNRPVRPDAGGERHAVSITRLCLRSGSIQLPYALAGRLPQGELLVHDLDRDDGIVLWSEPPRTVKGLGPLFDAHELQVNDQLVLELEGEDLRVSVVKRPRRTRPQVTPSTWESHRRPEGPPPRETVGPAAPPSDEGAEGPPAPPQGAEREEEWGPMRAPEPEPEPEDDAPRAPRVRVSPLAEGVRERPLDEAPLPPDEEAPATRAPARSRREREGGVLGGVWRAARGWLGRHDADDPDAAPSAPEPVRRDWTAAWDAEPEGADPVEPLAPAPWGTDASSGPPPTAAPNDRSPASTDDPPPHDAGPDDRFDAWREPRLDDRFDAPFDDGFALAPDDGAPPPAPSDAPRAPGRASEAAPADPLPADPAPTDAARTDPARTDPAPSGTEPGGAEPTDRAPAGAEPTGPASHQEEGPAEGPRPEPRGERVDPGAPPPAAGSRAGAEGGPRDPEEDDRASAEAAVARAAAWRPETEVPSRAERFLAGDLRTRLLRFLTSPDMPLIARTELIASRFDLPEATAREMLEDIADDPPPGIRLAPIRADAWRIERTRA